MKKSQAMMKQQIIHLEEKKNVDQQDLFPYSNILAAFQLSMYYRNLLSKGQKMNEVLRLEIAVEKD